MGLRSIRPRPMRVAILHDHLGFIGGGERLVLALAAAVGADLYVTDFDRGLPERLGAGQVHVEEIARVPRTPILRQERQVAAFSRARIPGYDLYVLSGNWAIAAAKRHRPNLWYCYTPVRVFYDLRDSFLGNLSVPARLAAQSWIRRARPRYEADVAAVQRIVVSSYNVADRVERYLGRPSEVVYPPVDTGRYAFREVGEAWLAVNRLSHEKRIGLQMETFRRLPRERLLIAGGPQLGVGMERFLRSVDPPPNVTVLGEVSDEELRRLYATCRGLIATSQDEDFGLTPVEAMASGKAVLAVDEGGYRETVVPGKTGWLLPPDPAAFCAAITKVRPEDLAAMREACEHRARDFDASLFVRRMRDLVQEAADAEGGGE